MSPTMNMAIGMLLYSIMHVVMEKKLNGTSAIANMIIFNGTMVVLAGAAYLSGWKAFRSSNAAGADFTMSLTVIIVIITVLNFFADFNTLEAYSKKISATVAGTLAMTMPIIVATIKYVIDQKDLPTPRQIVGWLLVSAALLLIGTDPKVADASP